MMRAWLAVVAVVSSGLVFPLACTSSDPTLTRDASPTPTGSAACQLAGGRCFAATGACCSQTGSLFDEARQCVTSNEQIIGCAPMPISTTACPQLGVVGCAITVQSAVRRVWFTSSQTPGWEPDEKCPDALAARVTAFKRCE